MKKRLFQPLVITLLLIAALSIFVVAPASAASTTQTHRATASTASTSLAKPAKIVVCHYLVTAYPGLNIRPQPNLNNNPIGSIPDNTVVVANESETYGSGYYWHNVFYGPTGWSAANWMQYEGNCAIVG